MLGLPRHAWRPVVAGLIGASLALSAVVRGQGVTTVPGASSPAARITGIEVNGLKRLNAAQVIELSGLQTGDPLEVARMQKATDRLLSLGIFASVKFRYDAPRGGILVFDIVEHPWAIPVVFDNFVWWTDAEVTAAVARVLPTFDNMAPQTDDAIRTITSVLEDLLKTQHINGHVVYMPSVKLDGTERRHRFQVGGVPLPVCALHFPGAAGIREADLVKASGMVGTEYWRLTLDSAITEKVMPLYRQRGYVLAAGTAPVTHFVSNASCQSGVDVSVALTEGPQFHMGAVTTIGLADGDAKKLVKAWPLKAGKIYDATVAAQFLNSAVVRQTAVRLRPKQLAMLERRDAAKATVDVVIAVK